MEITCNRLTLDQKLTNKNHEFKYYRIVSCDIIHFPMFDRRSLTFLIDVGTNHTPKTFLPAFAKCQYIQLSCRGTSTQLEMREHHSRRKYMTFEDGGLVTGVLQGTSVQLGMKMKGIDQVVLLEIETSGTIALPL